MNSTEQTMTFRCPSCNAAIEVSSDQFDTVLICPNDNCQKPFRAEIPSAEPVDNKVITPAAVNVSSHSDWETLDVAPQSQEPLKPKAKDASEVIVAETHHSPIMRFPLRFVSYVLAILACFAVVIWATIAQWWVLSIIFAMIGGYIVFRMAQWLTRSSNIVVRVTEAECIAQAPHAENSAPGIRLTDVAAVSTVKPWHFPITNVGDVVLVGDGDHPRRTILLGMINPLSIEEAVARGRRKDN